MEWFLVCLFLSLLAKSSGYCPSLCTCKSSRVGGDGSTELLADDQLKLRCGGPLAPITELKEIHLSDISDHVVGLNLSGNAVSTLSRELHLPKLQKLDLSHNQITLIESDAFYNMTSLQRLDLSYNQISNVYKDMFKNLSSLERLILTHNHISVLDFGTFEHLVGLKQLDIAENPLICDCELVWISDWSRNTTVKLTGNPKCAFPENMANKTVRKLKIFLDLSECGTTLQANSLIVKPYNNQLVFEGDSLTLSCNAPFASVLANYELKWVHPMLEICDVNITNSDMTEEGLAETVAFFPNVTNHHTGNWTCQYSDKNHIKHNHTVQVLVLTNETKYCPTDHTTDNKGLYSWPQSLVNHTVQVPCRLGDGLAYRQCKQNASWAIANTSSCSYISNITKLLQQFALLNVSLVQFSAVNATDRLAMLIKEKTYPIADILDPDDVKFIALAVKNYMQYVHEEKDLASSLIDVISASMNISSQVMTQSEILYGSCTEMLKTVEQLSGSVHNVQGQKSNMAVENFPLREGFSGVTCMWYTRQDSVKSLHCTTTNRTVTPLLTISDAMIHASVQIPHSLIYTKTMTGEHISTSKTTQSLVVSMYENSALLPLLPINEDDSRKQHRAKDYYGRSTKRDDFNMEITTPVVGFQLLNGELSESLIEPVLVTVRLSGEAVDLRAASWDHTLRRWREDTNDCKISHVVSDTVIMSCTKLAYVGLLQNVETGIYGARTDGARFKVSHPAIYVGSLILIGCLSFSIFTYIMCYPGIVMSKKSKHALINTWIAIVLLCFMYTLGIYQTEDVKLCQIVGLLIHYLSLCCLLWMCVCASNMYKWVTKTHSPVRTPEDEPSEIPVQKPILGLYLVGWGIAVIVCGISGAVNLKDYAGYSQCFLSTAPALPALFVPGGILLFFISIVFLLIRCTIRTINVQLSEGTQATENVDLEMWEPNINEANDRRSIKSAGESEIEDIERTPLVQLRALVIVLGLYLTVWMCGAIAVYRPLPAYLPYQEDICSIVYAVCSTILGTFILFFYGIARSDVRAQWLLMNCGGSQKKYRSRNVYDATQSQAQTLPLSLNIPNDNRSRSDSRSSNRTKTNNSAAFKAAAELNGHTLQKDFKNVNSKNPNINLVVLHRQQYGNRSNNSMTYTENASVGPEVFYNPNQMNVAKKFFKKQRQNVKKNCLELPTRRDCDSDSHFSLPLPTKEAYSGMASIINSGTKVNNTNIHVERSNTGVKETRKVQNPNLLEEDPNYKNYTNIDNIRNSFCKEQKQQNQIMNIYTNVPETQIPQHQVIKPRNSFSERNSVSEECLQSKEEPEMRTVSQQCSLEYSSASEMAIPHTCSDQTLDTHSEVTSFQDTQSALCSTNEITDTESFGQYIDYLQPKGQDGLDKSLQDISEECTMNSDANRSSTPQNLDNTEGEMDKLIDKESPDFKDKDNYAKTYDFETCSTNTSEHGFENESDIYCPNYQVSEVSIRSHGLYAPSPSSMCPNEINFSNEDVSNLENQYVNFDPEWRNTIKANKSDHSGASNPEANRDSPVSFSSDIDELYTQITRDGSAKQDNVLDATINSDVTLKPDSDSCVSETVSSVRGETTV